MQEVMTFPQRSIDPLYYYTYLPLTPTYTLFYSMYSLLGGIYVNKYTHMYALYLYVGYNLMELCMQMSLESICISFLWLWF